MKNVVFIWHHRYVNYDFRMMWMSAPWNLKLASWRADEMTLVPKEN